MGNLVEIMNRAARLGLVIPGFNIPYLPMMQPVVRALRDTSCFGLIMVARLEWEKFASGGVRQIYEEYQRVGDPACTRLHLDHVPVIDEDGKQVDYAGIIAQALELGYSSVMVDASRLPLEGNIAATHEIVTMAHARGAAVEAELGAVLGHEAGPRLPYEELFASGKGFTDPDEARRFVAQTGVDWLSIAVGSIHGAISAAHKDEKKVQARLNIEHLERIHQAAAIPLVLHGGTGIAKECILASIRHGIAKINIATAIRQPYERLMHESVARAQDAVYATMLDIIKNELQIAGSASRLMQESSHEHARN